MTDFANYFPQRIQGDRLDVIPLLQQGLERGGERCVLAYEGHEVSEAEMRARVVDVQAQLAEAGIRPGDRVAVMLSNSIEHVALIYALILSGVVWVPVNVRLRGAGLAYIVGHSCPALLVYDAEFEQPVAGLQDVRTLRLRRFAGPGSNPGALVCNHAIPHGAPLCIIYTSGTTGAPKGVVFTHRMLRIASEAALMVADMGAGDRAFLWEPLCHIGGAQMLMVPFLVPARLHVVRRFSASQFWSQWRAAEATHLHYLGGVLDVLMQLPESGAIRVAWGAGTSAQAWNPIRERFGCALRECYGMTECSSFATLNSSGTPGSIGAALPWIRVELLDTSGQPVADGQPGEMVLSTQVEGAFLPGYLDNPEATRQALRDGKLHTGDMARRLPNGEYAFVGRRTDSMRVRGENVSAWEVERVFIEHPGIRMAAAVGVPSAIGEQDIFLHVLFEPGATVGWHELVAWAQPRLASFQLPRYYTAAEAFELTPSERIRKHLLSSSVADAWDRTLQHNPPGAMPMSNLNEPVVVHRCDAVGVIRLNRPEKLNAWTVAMRNELMRAMKAFEADGDVRAIVLTGTGERAFCAGQDLEEAHGFSVDEAEAWIRGWDVFYSVLRGLSKPLVIALNGLAAGSAFQASLMGDVRVGHAGVRMGQPEINSGIASITGPWIMNQMLGMSRTIELTLTGRLMEADESHRLGLIHHIVPKEDVLARAIAIANELGSKPPVAMALDKARFREMTEPSFRETIEAAVRAHRTSYESNEPQRMVEAFYRTRGGELPAQSAAA